MQRDRREKSYKSSNLFFFFAINYNPTWAEMTDTNPKNQDYQQKCQLTPWNSTASSTTLTGVNPKGFCSQIKHYVTTFQLSHNLFESNCFPCFPALHTCVTWNIKVPYFICPGYQSSRCWCWCGMRMLSTSLSQYKWTWWRWWLRAVINALWSSGVAIQDYPRVVFVAHFFTENRCWFCHLLMFPCRIFHTIFTW